MTTVLIMTTNTPYRVMARQEFQMELTSEHGSNAAKKVLTKLEGLDEGDIEIHLERRALFVTSDLSPDLLLATLKKTGIEVHYIGIAREERKTGV